MLTTYQRLLEAHRKMGMRVNMIPDPDLECHYCSHEHRGLACPAPCGCFWFVSETSWRAEGERREVPNP